MICQQCGAEVGSAKFCTECGAKVEAPAPDPTPAPEPAPDPTPAPEPEPAQATCANCGAPLTSAFCTVCGTAAGASAGQQQAGYQQQPAGFQPQAGFQQQSFQQQMPQQPAQKSSKIPVIIGIVIAIVVVILLGLGACALFGGSIANDGTCAWDGCSQEAEYGDYCFDHVCLYGDCTNPRVSEDDMYCSEHMDLEYSSDSTSGTSATCAWPGCNAEADWGDYCINHVCMHGSCTNPIANENVEYCTEHLNS